jgi:signal peptide peptidase SppA
MFAIRALTFGILSPFLVIWQILLRLGVVQEKEVVVTPVRALRLYESKTLLPSWPYWRNKRGKKRRAYILYFVGDKEGADTDKLAKEISTVLDLWQNGDQVVICLESPGGDVYAYFECAAQVMRLRQREVPLTICVPNIATSGGYIVACIGNKIIASPYATVGSIGVICVTSNVGPLLEKLGIEIVMLTSGARKVDDNPFMRITEARKLEAERQVREFHAKFKAHVKRYRPDVDIDVVATGEAWMGEEAKEQGLVDEIGTYEDELRRLEADGYELLSVQCSSWKPKDRKKEDVISVLLEELRGMIGRVLKRSRF